jgi:hypothetical protein
MRTSSFDNISAGLHEVVVVAKAAVTAALCGKRLSKVAVKARRHLLSA